MEIKVKSTKDGFRVIFDIKSMGEARAFHDKVAIKIAKGPSEFIGDVYDRFRHRSLPNKKYTI